MIYSRQDLAALLGIGIGLWLLTTIINKIITAYRRSIFKKSLDCAQPPFLPTRNLGIDNVRALFRANRDRYLPPYLVSRRQLMVKLTGRTDVRTFKSRLLHHEIIHTSEPKNIQALLATQFGDFSLGDVRQRSVMPVFGKGIFSVSGEEWTHARSELRPQFSRQQIADLELEERHVQVAMRALPVVDADGWTAPSPLQKMFFRLTMDTATEFLFGQSCESQLTALGIRGTSDGTIAALAENFSKSFDFIQDTISPRAKMDAVRWFIRDPPDYKQHVQIVHGFVDHFVALALDSDKKGDAEKGEKYVFAEGIAAGNKDPLALRSQLLHVLLAGRDTTASLLSWLFRCLIEHPEVYTKLRKTVINDFGPYNDGTDVSNITFSGLKSCRYLQHCLNEALRLYPVVPLNRRQAFKDTSLPCGGGPDGSQRIFVKKDQMVEFSIYVMHRDPTIWGLDANEFRPERWAETGLSGGAKRGWDYLPFGGGPRICIGQQFALTEAGYVTTRLLQRFEEIEAVLMDEGGDVLRMGKMALDSTPGFCKYWSTLTTAPGDAVTVRFKEARA